MSNLTGRKPYEKEAKGKKDEKYLREVRRLRCCVCRRFGEQQRSQTTAHHPIHDRHSTRKRMDKTAIPLCEGHHQGLWDTTKIAIHKEPRLWREAYGPDWSFVQETQTSIEGILS